MSTGFKKDDIVLVTPSLEDPIQFRRVGRIRKTTDDLKIGQLVTEITSDIISEYAGETSGSYFDERYYFRLPKSRTLMRFDRGHIESHFITSEGHTPLHRRVVHAT